MKQYFAYFKLRFITGLQYRAAAIAGLSTQLFFGFIFIMVFIALYESSSVVAPMKIEELVTYMWLNQAFFSLMFLYAKDHELLSAVKNGDIAYELCRPQEPYFKWYIKMLSTKLSNVCLRCLPVLILAFMLPKPYTLALPNSLLAFILFLISLSLGALLVTAIVTLFHIVTFYTLDERGVVGMLIVVAEFFAGAIIPVAFLPKSVQIIGDYLPFKYLFDLPYRVYSGNITIDSSYSLILMQFIWLVIIVTIGYCLTKKALRKVVVQGG